MAIEVTQKYPREVRRVEVELDGDTFYVLADTRAYGFTKQLEWFERMEPFKREDGSIGLTSESAGLVVEWALGIIRGFEGITENDEPLRVDRETLDRYPEVLIKVFPAVMEAITPKKMNGAVPMDSGSGSTPTELEELAPAVP